MSQQAKGFEWLWCMCFVDACCLDLPGLMGADLANIVNEAQLSGESECLRFEWLWCMFM